ncbi:MAG: hypothetical protein FWF04_05280, partial [Clostridiales bacterium]|nr:hypothetical protein [Clostridiales bacterium]
MQKSLSKRIIADFTLHVGERSFLQQFSRSKKAATALMRDEALLRKLAALNFDAGRISCAEVLSVCESALAMLAPAPEEGWLSFAYRFGCDMLFPDEGFARRRVQYGDGALFFLALLQVMLDTERAA